MSKLFLLLIGVLGAIVVLILSGFIFRTHYVKPGNPPQPITPVIRSKNSVAPIIDAIIPPSGPAGVAYPIPATIRGSGFMSTGNIVTFGPVQIQDLPSPDGRHITFAVPKEVPSRGEVPPEVLYPREYPVTVTTPAGTSRPVVFIMTRGL